MVNGYNVLPTKLFKVRVPIVATYSEEELDIFGIAIDVVDGKLKKDSYKELTVVMINLDKIIDIYIQGYPISLVNGDETAEIYKILEDYLSGIDYSDNYSPNRIRKTDGRLEEIDKFAAEIFGLNRYKIVKANVNASHGYDIGATLMQVNKPNTVGQSRPTGVMAGYSDTVEPVDDRYTYINNFLPDIDIESVKRRSMYKDVNLLESYNT